MSKVAIQSLPSGAGDARRPGVATWPCLAGNCIAPVPRRGNACDGRPGRIDHDHLCLARPAERQTHCHSVRRRSVATRGAQGGSCCWRPISATCVRTQPSTKAKRSAKRLSAGCSRRRWIASSRWTLTFIARPTSERFFPASRPKTSRPCRRSPTRCAATGIDPATIVVGPDAESRPWVSDLAGQLGTGACGRKEDSPRRSLRRNRICRAGIDRRPAGAAG